MSDLAQVLAATPGPTWITGVVDSVGGGSLTLQFGGGLVSNCGYLDSYSPVVGDVVHALSWSKQGVLVIGSDNKTAARTTLPEPPTGVTVNASTWATYQVDTGAWVSGVVQQAPSKCGTWFYATGAFNALADAMLAKVEMSCIAVSGGPPELAPVANPSAVGPLSLYSTVRYAHPGGQPSVTTWIPLPLDWGYALIAGQIRGVAVGGGLYTGAYSGAGNSIRLTTL